MIARTALLDRACRLIAAGIPARILKRRDDASQERKA